MHCTVLPESDDICDWRVFPFCKGDNFSRTRNLSFRIRSAKDNSSTWRIKILHRRQTKNILNRRQTKKSLHRSQTKKLYIEDKQKVFTLKTNQKSVHGRQTKNLYIKDKPKILSSQNIAFNGYSCIWTEVFHTHYFSKLLLLTRTSLFLTDMYKCTSTLYTAALPYMWGRWSLQLHN